MSARPETPRPFEDAHRRLKGLCQALEAVIVGQEAVIEHLVIACFAGGHVLIEGLPGLGKTQLVKALTGLLGLTSGRIQCTPDLMPADITGTEVLAPGMSAVVFRPGPVFTQLLLVDEINRATPRTQAALLEAMQEHQVTCSGETHPLPEPFIVIATQNPIELEGTFPLPEAQLDRFLFKLRVGYPGAPALRAVLEVSLDEEPSAALRPMLAPEAIAELGALCRTVLVSEECKRAAVALVLATQPQAAASAPVHSLAQRHLRYGASPRALQSLVRAGRVHAVLAGRAHLDLEDLAAVALPVLRHRVLLKLESELEGVEIDRLLRELIEQWRTRR